MADAIKIRIVDRRNILMFLACGIFVALGLYFYLFGHTVYNVVKRQTAEGAISATLSRVEKLESSYLDLKNGINDELAVAKGFVGISAATYISRKTLGQGLTLNNEI